MYSFLACGISNTLNGSEDYLIRKESSVQKKDYQGKEHCDPFESDSDCDEFEGFDPEDIPRLREELQDKVIVHNKLIAKTVRLTVLQIIVKKG